MSSPAGLGVGHWDILFWPTSKRPCLMLALFTNLWLWQCLCAVCSVQLCSGVNLYQYFNYLMLNLILTVKLYTSWVVGQVGQTIILLPSQLATKSDLISWLVPVRLGSMRWSEKIEDGCAKNHLTKSFIYFFYAIPFYWNDCRLSSIESAGTNPHMGSPVVV